MSMTDNGFSFGSLGDQTPAGRPVDKTPEAPVPSHKRGRLALGAAGAAAAVALAAVAVVTMGGGEDPAQTAAPATPPKASATAAVTAAPTMIPAAFDGLTGTDPFRPLIVEAATGSGGAQAPGGQAPGGQAPGGQAPVPNAPLPNAPAPNVPLPVPTVTITVPGNPVPGPTTTVTAGPVAGWTVRVIAIAADGSTADVAVNGQMEKAVAKGTTFGGGLFAYLGATGTNATIQFGDTSFSLKAGNALTVM
jgi:hypothetical protein